MESANGGGPLRWCRDGLCLIRNLTNTNNKSWEVRSNRQSKTSEAFDTSKIIADVNQLIHDIFIQTRYLDSVFGFINNSMACSRKLLANLMSTRFFKMNNGLNVWLVFSCWGRNFAGLIYWKIGSVLLDILFGNDTSYVYESTRSFCLHS